MTSINPLIRWMIRRDMEEVLLIERRSFEYFWTEEDFLSCLRQRNAIGMVAEHNQKIVGFMVYELLKSQLHLLNFAVDPQFRRAGVGKAMVSKMVAKLSQQKRSEIRAEVRETNLSAQLFFRSCGFSSTKVLRGYYDETDEDAYVMRYVLGAKPVVQNRITQYFSELGE